jgi:hypothetical protein
MFSKLNPFSRKPKLPEDTMPLVVSTEGQVLAEERKKLLIMKHRNMTEEQVDAYLREKKVHGGGVNAQRGSSALGWALAPGRN